MPDFDKKLAKQNGMSDAAIEAADSIKKNQQEGQIKYPIWDENKGRERTTIFFPFKPK